MNWLKRRESRPFFLYLPFNAPHTPIQDPDARGTAEWRNGHRPTYAKMVERMDSKIGTVLAQLDAMGAAGNTIVVFLSDNGADPNGSNGALRGRKSSLFEGGVRVPCMARWPEALPAGGTIDQVALTMDWFPTLLSAVGIGKPKEPRFDGIDLMPFLKSGRRASPRLVFWRYKRGDRVRKAARDGDLKYISDAGEEFVFDLARDERESDNLLKSMPGRAASLKAKLADWERDVMAPRLKPFRSEPG
ncbi:MAG: sulfatase-like hydrolase/transferase [Bryobacteraceae bacterium]